MDLVEALRYAAEDEERCCSWHTRQAFVALLGELKRLRAIETRARDMCKDDPDSKFRTAAYMILGLPEDL